MWTTLTMTCRAAATVRAKAPQGMPSFQPAVEQRQATQAGECRLVITSMMVTHPTGPKASYGPLSSWCVPAPS